MNVPSENYARVKTGDHCTVMKDVLISRHDRSLSQRLLPAANSTHTVPERRTPVLSMNILDSRRLKLGNTRCQNSLLRGTHFAGLGSDQYRMARSLNPFESVATAIQCYQDVTSDLPGGQLDCTLKGILCWELKQLFPLPCVFLAGWDTEGVIM
jgi:hypothetical protein